MKLIAQSGLGLDKFNAMTDRLMREKLPGLKNVVLALGIVDWMRTKNCAAVQFYTQSAVESIQNLLPDVKIFLSGITPSKGTTLEVRRSNEGIKQINEYAKILANNRPNVHYINSSMLFNFPHPNAINRMASGDRTGVHLNKQGKADLMNHIVNAVEQLVCSTPNSKKRNRSSTETPPSAEKDSKTSKIAINSE